MTEQAKEVRAVTVSQLNRYVAGLFSRNQALQNIMVRGELSNVKRYSSGHWYFNLKDPYAQVSGVMFKSYADRLKFKPQEGQEVLVTAQVSLYERNGSYQLNVRSMEPLGKGSLYLAYEQIKKALAQEGLFDSEHKKKLPTFPKTIGVVTSVSGAVIRDIIHVSKRRFPGAKIILYPAQVQGQGSAETIIRGIRYFNTRSDIDVLIVGRGGGSIEDLWSFNDEKLAREAFNSRIPLISAVGHETDFTILDFVADLRAPTPSAAAELALPDQAALQNGLNGVQKRLARGLESKLASATYRLDRLASSPYLKSPYVRLEQRGQTLDLLEERLKRSLLTRLERSKNRFSRNAGLLDSLSPLKVLGRGYSMVQDPDSGKTLSKAGALALGQEIDVLMQDGKVTCQVQNLKMEDTIHTTQD